MRPRPAHGTSRCAPPLRPRPQARTVSCLARSCPAVRAPASDSLHVPHRHAHAPPSTHPPLEACTCLTNISPAPLRTHAPTSTLCRRLMRASVLLLLLVHSRCSSTLRCPQQYIATTPVTQKEAVCSEHALALQTASHEPARAADHVGYVGYRGMAGAGEQVGAPSSTSRSPTVSPERRVLVSLRVAPSCTRHPNTASMPSRTRALRTPMPDGNHEETRLACQAHASTS